MPITIARISGHQAIVMVHSNILAAVLREVLRCRAGPLLIQLLLRGASKIERADAVHIYLYD